MEIEVRSIYEIGQRANQEDSIYPPLGKATPEDRLFILCDGMGGHEHGEVASASVCQTMSTYIKGHYAFNRPFTPNDFNAALNAAYDDLDAKDNQNDAKKMGTTLTFLLFHPKGAFVAHIGDSRIYQIRPSEKKIMLKTRDHSLVNDLIDIGELTPEEAKTSKRKNIITRAMQPHQDHRCMADVAQITDLKEGDWFMLCSDGMLEEMEDQNIVNILSNPETSIDEKVNIMSQVSKNSRDNHSAHLIHVIDIASVKKIPEEKPVMLEELEADSPKQEEMTPKEEEAKAEVIHNQETKPEEKPEKAVAPEQKAVTVEEEEEEAETMVNIPQKTLSKDVKYEQELQDMRHNMRVLKWGVGFLILIALSLALYFIVPKFLGSIDKVNEETTGQKEKIEKKMDEEKGDDVNQANKEQDPLKFDDKKQ